MRSDTKAAAAWSNGFVIGAGTDKTNVVLVAARGIYIDYPVSSFLAEAIALVDTCSIAARLIHALGNVY